ncbi:MAG: nucleotidyltransferase domain-containing protein [Steroidobacteraceae bacterium]|jgi:predicted nucleotidyltransferase|nr:nucleotidyltransferase domain-containing protein [Steroidobacteraceae bacterium]
MAAHDPIPPQVRDEIRKRLAGVVRDHGVRLLLAIESGSRAWGFASPDSDYDVRFVYARPAQWYASIDLEERRDVIEQPIVDDIDLNGWDLRKALRLFWRSNPAFIEWIQSPIEYVDSTAFAARARQLLPDVYSTARGIHHYRSMAKTNYRGYLRRDLVPLKKYFYVLRPLFAVRWIEHYGSAPPIEFERLLPMAADASGVLEEVDALLRRKRASGEIAEAPPVKVLNEYIERELNRLDQTRIPVEPRTGAADLLSAWFRELITP